MVQLIPDYRFQDPELHRNEVAKMARNARGGNMMLFEAFTTAIAIKHVDKVELEKLHTKW